MTPKQVADLGVARLALPVPMAKLAAIQAIARALDNAATAENFADALVKWIGTRELESQCLEAICPLLLSTTTPSLIARIRSAISRPSLASDLLLSMATGNPVIVPSWSGCHSGPAPALLDLEQEENELSEGRIIPRVFAGNLEDLEDRSGHLFLRQWAFEYSVLKGRAKGKKDGYLEYFLGSERKNVCPLLPHSGHLARSAYLRTLACAVDHWGMPTDMAVEFAACACPAEPIFLKLAPQAPPDWAQQVHAHTSAKPFDPQMLATTVIQQIEGSQQRCIMHCSLVVVDEARFHAELEVFAVVPTKPDMDAQTCLGFYSHLLGTATPSRDGLRAFVSPKVSNKGTAPLGFVPLVLPLIGSSLGYLQFDLLGRVPYMPVSTKNVPRLELIAEPSSTILRDGNRAVGKWNWWLWNWKPSHPANWPPPIACCTNLDLEVAQQLAKDLGGQLEHVWKLTTWQRDQDYGEWHAMEHFGRRQVTLAV
ncbi:TPA: hypothetical protein ACNIJL_006124 [Pseudomonas aeruginosa]